MARRVLGWMVGAGLLLFACTVDPLLGNECQLDSDCEGAWICASSVCVPPCLVDSDCGDAGPDARCQFNRCVVPFTPETPDLSVAGDGALADASTADAAQPDAAPADAAPADAAPADAALADAALADAAEVDAIAADAATDAAEGDAAEADAAEADATPDAG